MLALTRVLQPRYIQLSFCASFSKKYKKENRSRHNTNKHESWRDVYKPQDADGHDKLQTLQDLEDSVQADTFVDEVHRRKEKSSSKHIMAVIKRKYFKRPQEMNVLTYDAKCQMHYLHQEYPNEWTIERLAESFPVSVEGVKAVLQAINHYPSTVEEVIKHDKRVLRRWKEIESGGGEEGGPLALRYEQLKQEGKLQLIANAAGITALPCPAEGRYLTGATQEPQKPGIFSSIVKEYCDKKTLDGKNANKIEPSAAQKLLQDESVKLLSSVMSSFGISKEKGARSINKPLSLPDRDTSGVYNKFRYADSNVTLPQEHLTSEKESQRKFQSMLDADFDSFKEENQENVNELRSRSDSSGRVDPSMRDTGHTTSINSSRHETERDFTNINTNSDLSGSYSSSEYHQKSQPDMVYDVPRNSVSNKRESYIYSEQGGYQHPYGHEDPEAGNIEVPKMNTQQKPGDLQVYQKGNCVYDEDGELLYKIP